MTDFSISPHAEFGHLLTLIYDRAAPIPDVTPSPNRNAFLQEINEAMREAAVSIGPTLL